MMAVIADRYIAEHMPAFVQCFREHAKEHEFRLFSDVFHVVYPSGGRMSTGISASSLWSGGVVV